MKDIIGKVVEVNVGTSEQELAKYACNELQVELDGCVGDCHRSSSRETWQGDKQPQGTIRRNERQWSATSVEEMADMAIKMDLKEPLTAATLSVNICFEGIPKLSVLPKGTLLKFASGAELMVEEYNPPCIEMSEKIASSFTTNSSEPLARNAFIKAALFTRGLVGVVEVAGNIKVGDEVKVKPYQPPVWMVNFPK